MLYHLKGMATKDPKERFVAVVPAGQKFVRPKKTGGSMPENRIRLAYRLLTTLDDALRTLMRRRGELTTFMIEALETAASKGHNSRCPCGRILRFGVKNAGI